MSETAPANPTIGEMRQQLQELIDASPHNDHIIREGEYCRSADFLTHFGEETIKRLLQIYSDHQPVVRPMVLAEECEASLGKYFRTKDASHLQIAVAIGSLIAYHISLDAENLVRGVMLSVFARSLLTQWQKGRSDDKLLDDSIDYCRKAVELGPPQGINRALHLNDLGEQLSGRYVRRHDAADYAEAESCFEQASTLRPAGRPVFLFRWARLVRFREEYEKLDQAEMLRNYIGKLRVATASQTNEFQPTDYRVSISCIWWHFRWAFWERYKLNNEAQDLEHARTIFGFATTAPRHGPTDLFRACQDQGRVIALQFKKNGNLEDGKAAVDLLKKALQIMPNSSPAVESLGNHLRIFANYTDSDEMLAESAEILDRAYRATTQPSDGLCDAQALTLMQQFERTGKTEDIDVAIQRFRTLANRPHELEKDHANTFLKLSQCLLLRFESLEQEDDLTKALVTIARTATFKTIPASLRAECLRVLGKISDAKYKWKNQTKFLDEAIAWYQRALEKNGDNEEDNYLIHHDLGNAYYFKFKTTLLVADLFKSIGEYQSALRAPQQGEKSPSKRDVLMSTAGLATALAAQFEITQQQRDIDMAIACYEKCVQGTAKKTLRYATRANNLAHPYQERFKITRQMADVKQSQAILLEVLSWDLNLPPHDRCNMYNKLGTAFLLSYCINKEPTYLDYAMEHFLNALATGCKIPAFLVTASSNLSFVLRYKANKTKIPKDQVAALTQIQASLKYLGSMPGNSQASSMDAIIFNMVEFILDGWRDSNLNATSEYGKIYVRISESILPRLRARSGSTVAGLYIYAALAQYIVAKKPGQPAT